MSCTECINRYNKQYEAYQDCMKRHDKYKKDGLEMDAEINRSQIEIETLQERIGKLETKMNQCKNKKKSLLEDIKQWQEKTDCAQYIEKIDELEHDLGECNVEWGSCQLKGRQKDALDKKRIEAIEDQKRKFAQCNKQLREYKQKAKEYKK